MIALIQRVTEASVEVENKIVGQIKQGLLVLLGVEKEDSQEKAERLVQKVLNYRVFADDQGKMNLNVQQINGEVLVVSQFTLAANTQKGLRPSFSDGASLCWLKIYITILFKNVVKKYQLLQAYLELI